MCCTTISELIPTVESLGVSPAQLRAFYNYTTGTEVCAIVRRSQQTELSAPKNGHPFQLLLEGDKVLLQQISKVIRQEGVIETVHKYKLYVTVTTQNGKYLRNQKCICKSTHYY